MSLLEIALEYAAHGWHVFPLHTPGEGGHCDCRRPDCRNPGKHPRTRNGLNDATTDDATIRRWWGMWGGMANIGISTGPSGLLVIDIDPRHDGDETFRTLSESDRETWLNTPTVLTGGGGQHYYYQAPDEPMRNSAGLLGPGIDVRGEGGYVVAPPSLHPSGHHWEWETGLSWLEMPLGVYPGPRPSREQREAGPVGDIIPEGQRDQTLASIAGTLRRRGLGEREILATLRETNAHRCLPPLPDSELQRIAHSIGQYEPEKAIRAKLVRATQYSRLRKIATDPPTYLIHVIAGDRATDVRLRTAQLMRAGGFRAAALEQADVYLPVMTEREWETQLGTLMRDLEVLPAPEDASELGVLWYELCRWIRQSARDEDDEEALSKGKPWQRDDGYVYFSGPMARSALKGIGFNAPAPMLWESVRIHGGVQWPVRITGKVFKCWRISRETLEGDDELLT